MQGKHLTYCDLSQVLVFLFLKRSPGLEGKPWALPGMAPKPKTNPPQKKGKKEKKIETVIKNNLSPNKTWTRRRTLVNFFNHHRTLFLSFSSPSINENRKSFCFSEASIITPEIKVGRSITKVELRSQVKAEKTVEFSGENSGLPFPMQGSASQLRDPIHLPFSWLTFKPLKFFLDQLLEHHMERIRESS